VHAKGNVGKDSTKHKAQSTKHKAQSTKHKGMGGEVKGFCKQSEQEQVERL